MAKNDYVLKTYGDVVVTAESMMDEEQVVIPVSPSIDVGLHGGIIPGIWVILGGPAKGGKTTTALHMAANIQQYHTDRDIKIQYIDVEARLKRMNLEQCKHLKLNQFDIVKSFYNETTGERKILDAESFLDIGEKFLTDNPYGVLIIDSLSALCSAKEMSSEMGDRDRSPTSILLSKFIKRCNQLVQVNKCTVICMTHEIANITGYGASVVETGGSKIKYQSDVKMRIKKVEAWEADNRRIGQKVTWQILFAALGAPGQEVESFIRYGEGIDETEEIINLAVATGLIEQKASWYNIKFLDDNEELKAVTECKHQGREKLAEYLKNKKDLIEVLGKKVKELI